MSLLLALSGGAPPAVDLFAPTLDDGPPRRRVAPEGLAGLFRLDVDLFVPTLVDAATRRRWADDFTASLPIDPPAAPVDTLAPILDDGAPRPAAWDACWITTSPDAPPAAPDLFAGMLDDGAAAIKRWGEEFTSSLPQDAQQQPVFSAVLDDGFVRRRVPDAVYAYLPPNVEAPPVPPAPSVGGYAKRRTYDRSQQTRRRNEAILAVIIAAVTSGDFE